MSARTSPRTHSWSRSVCPTCSVHSSPKVPSRRRSSRCSTANWPKAGGERGPALDFAERSLVRPVRLSRRDDGRDAGRGLAAYGPPLRRFPQPASDARPIRFRGRTQPDHHPLSDADLPCFAARRDPQLARQILGQCRRADPAQYRDGRRRYSCSTERRQNPRGFRRFRCRSVGVLQLGWLFFACRAAGVSLRPRAAAHRPRGEAADEADPSGRHRRRRRPAQPRRLDRPVRLSARRGLDLVHLLRRSGEPAPARA